MTGDFINSVLTSSSTPHNDLYPINSTNMKKLLLTSDGFSNKKISDRFFELVDKKPSEIKVLFIPTASRYEDELKYVKLSENELVSLGIIKENVTWLDIEDVEKAGELKNYDVVYVCGGNTFFLMKKLIDTGLDKKIIEMIDAGKVYVGVSAGSVIAGPDISIAGPFDENDVGLQSMAGLGLTEKIVSPHYQRKEKQIIEDFKSKLPYEIVPLCDGQAYLEADGVISIIL